MGGHGFGGRKLSKATKKQSDGNRYFNAAKRGEAPRRRTVFPEENTASRDNMQLLLRDGSSDEGATFLSFASHRGERGATASTSASLVEDSISMRILGQSGHSSGYKGMDTESIVGGFPRGHRQKSVLGGDRM